MGSSGSPNTMSIKSRASPPPELSTNSRPVARTLMPSWQGRTETFGLRNSMATRSGRSRRVERKLSIRFRPPLAIRPVLRQGRTVRSGSPNGLRTKLACSVPALQIPSLSIRFLQTRLAQIADLKASRLDRMAIYGSRKRITTRLERSIRRLERSLNMRCQRAAIRSLLSRGWTATCGSPNCTAIISSGSHRVDWLRSLPSTRAASRSVLQWGHDIGITGIAHDGGRVGAIARGGGGFREAEGLHRPSRGCSNTCGRILQKRGSLILRGCAPDSNRQPENSQSSARYL